MSDGAMNDEDARIEPELIGVPEVEREFMRDARNEIGDGDATRDEVAVEFGQVQAEPELSGTQSEFPPAPEYGQPEYPQPANEPQLIPPAPPRPVRRIPNFVDAVLLMILVGAGLLVTICVLGLTVYFHWFGIRDLQSAQNDARVTLGTELVWYVVTFAGAFPAFPLIWGKSFFAGVHWHAATAFRWRYRLIGTALLCNLIAILGNWLLPFPKHAPIDKLFNKPMDAWMLSIFGITIAPFFEEMVFRGFLLPAIATAWDWCGERMSKKSPRPLDGEGNPVWSAGAMVFASLAVSVPFALMHSAQVGAAWGPLSLLYAVSLILCVVRLTTRSLAASTMVHATYNFLLFAVMFVETGGFRHLEKLQ